MIKPDALKFFIPFATLKLRMAGPVLGRILKSEINTKFVSANLPMLHNRTVESIGQSEFRAGVKNNERRIDLGNEFIRQFYGDVMLFTMEKITAQGFPGKSVAKDRLRIILDETYIKIKDNYIEKHHTILSLKAQISTQLNSKDRWWNNTSTDSHTVDTSLANFNSFLNNIQANFDEDSNAYQQITLPRNAKQHLDKILDAILHYSSDLQHWNKILNNQAARSFQK